MRDADKGTPLGGEPKHEKPPAPSRQTGVGEGNAKADEGKREENRRKLGVDEEHKTDAMQGGKRGTFP